MEKKRQSSRKTPWPCRPFRSSIIENRSFVHLVPAPHVAARIYPFLLFLPHSHLIPLCLPWPYANLPVHPSSPPRRRRTFIHNLPLKNPLLVPRSRGQLFPRCRSLGADLSFPLDFADAFTAVAFDVFGQFDEVEDVFLLGC